MRNPCPTPFLRLAAVALLAFSAARAQDPSLKDTFQQAKALWATQGDKEGASARFEQVLAALEPKGHALDADWTQVLCETYNWLAILDDRTPAKRPRVQKDLESLLALNPDFDVDRNLTNARLQGVFDGLRAAKLCRVKLTVSPEGGQLSLDGKPGAPGLSGTRYLAPGPHVLSYGRPGYQTLEQHVELALKETKNLDFNLTRISSTVTFYAYPAETEVLLDGKSLGRTGGHAPASAKSLVEPLGLAVEQFSAPFVVSELPAGKHVLEIQASCYQTRRIALPEDFATPFADHLLEPVKLEASRGRLSIASPTPGGELFLSGKSYGPLPVKDLSVCAGTYDLQVRFAAGGYSQRLVLDEGKALDLQIRPRPRLAFLGLDGNDDFAGRERLQAMLGTLGERLKEVAYAAPQAGEALQAAQDRVKAGREAEMTLVARPVPGKPIHQVELVLSTLTGEEEHYLVKPLEADPLDSLVARMNARPALSVPWVGAVVLDVPGESGAWVLQADAAALKAGLKAGKAITAVNGKPVPNVQGFRALLREAKGDRITLTQTDANVTLPLTAQPVELPVNSPALCYPSLLAELRIRALGATGDEAGLLRLQQALALMHFREYDKALEVLRDARIGATQGVSQGTLDYYTGICLLRMGNVYLPEATQALNQALKATQAMLFGPEGPLVPILARQALEDLKP